MNTAEKTLKDRLEKHLHLDAKQFETIEKSKTFNSWDEVFTSDEYADLWEGFQGKEQRAAIWRRNEFLGAFTVDRNPSENYGRPYDIWVHYIADGMFCIQKLEIHSSLTSCPMRVVEIFDDSVLFTDKYIKKTPQGRKYAKDNKIIVC